MDIKALILSGSPRPASLSVRIAHHLHHRLEGTPGVTVHMINMQENALPPVREVWKTVDLVPDPHRPLYDRMMWAQALLVVSPEYNGGYSAILKNFLDHFPKPAYVRKAWGIATGSTGAMGGMRASLQLQLLGSALSAIVSPRMLITPKMDQRFDEAGHLLDDTFAPQIDSFLEEWLWLAGRLAGVTEITGSGLEKPDISNRE